jgi:hypothetical protein
MPNTLPIGKNLSISLLSLSFLAKPFHFMVQPLLLAKPFYFMAQPFLLNKTFLLVTKPLPIGKTLLLHDETPLLQNLYDSLLNLSLMAKPLISPMA